MRGERGTYPRPLAARTVDAAVCTGPQFGRVRLRWVSRSSILAAQASTASSAPNPSDECAGQSARTKVRDIRATTTTQKKTIKHTHSRQVRASAFSARRSLVFRVRWRVEARESVEQVSGVILLNM